MKQMCERLWPVALLVLMAATMAPVTPVLAFTPQTIVIDGVNDFNTANLLDNDTGDTEIKNWCTDDPEDDAPMDLGKIYVLFLIAAGELGNRIQLWRSGRWRNH